MAVFGNLEVLKLLSSTSSKIAQGEILQLEHKGEVDMLEETYLKIISSKTAVLFSAATKVGAILSKKNNKEKEALEFYGKNLGLAFQMVDDILDITSDAKTLGKPAMNDFVEGKCTLPYIYLYEELDDTDKEKLKNLHAKKLDKEDSMWIKQKMKEHRSIEKSFELAKKLSHEAMQAIKDDKELVDILETMIKRSY